MDQLRLAYLGKLNPACIRYGLCGLIASSEPDHYRPNPSPLMLWHTRLSRMYVTGKHTYQMNNHNYRGIGQKYVQNEVFFPWYLTESNVTGFLYDGQRCVVKGSSS